MPDAHHLGCAGSADLGHDAVGTTEGREATLTLTVLDAFALAILATDGSPNFPNMPEANIDAAQPRDALGALDRATAAMYRLDPGAGSYLSESDFFLTIGMSGTGEATPPDWHV